MLLHISKAISFTWLENYTGRSDELADDDPLCTVNNESSFVSHLGEVTPEENGYVYCRMAMVTTNLTVVGIYDPWDFGNPTLGPNPIFTTWEVLEETQRAALMDNDHMYLGVTVDKGQLPTTSTADAAEWLENLGTQVQDGNYTDEGVELYYTDIISGTITFLNIFLGLIQIFDYIIMIPIVFLSKP